MKSDLTTFYIMRHAESEANVAKQMGLNPKSLLTSTGLSQAQAIATKLKHIHFDLILSSDIIRAKQTAEIIAQEKKLAVTTTEALRERSYGRLNGKTRQEMREELKELYDLYDKMSAKEKFTHKLVEDMETAQEALERFIRYIRELSIAYRGKRILLVSHFTLLRVLLIHLGFADHEEIKADHNIKNTSYVVIESDGVDFFIKKTHGIEKTTES